MLEGLYLVVLYSEYTETEYFDLMCYVEDPLTGELDWHEYGTGYPLRNELTVRKAQMIECWETGEELDLSRIDQFGGVINMEDK